MVVACLTEVFDMADSSFETELRPVTYRPRFPGVAVWLRANRERARRCHGPCPGPRRVSDGMIREGAHSKWHGSAVNWKNVSLQDLMNQQLTWANWRGLPHDGGKVTDREVFG